MIWIPTINAFINNGDFLLACLEDDAVPSICRVTSVVPPNQLRVTWWWTRDTLASSFVQLVALPPLTSENHNYLQQCKLKEVTERMLSVSTIQVVKVKDIAFAFHADIIETDLLDVAGMARVYYTRFRYNMDDRLVPVDCRVFNPFYHSICESYASRIWWSILEVKESVAKLLNDSKQYQICKKSVSCKLSLESWRYFVRSMQLYNPIYSEYTRRQTRKILHPNLTLSSHSRKILLKLLRIDSTRSIEGARFLFGITFGVGIRNRPPNKGLPPRSMHYGDVVNIVDVPLEHQLNQAERYKEFTCSQGVDFIYNESCRALKIRVRYSRVLAECHLVSSTLGLDHFIELDANNLPLTNVTAGDFFTRDGNLLEVVSVNGNEVVVIDELEQQYHLDLDEARRLLQQYIS